VGRLWNNTEIDVDDYGLDVERKEVTGGG